MSTTDVLLAMILWVLCSATCAGLAYAKCQRPSMHAALGLIFGPLGLLITILDRDLTRHEAQ